MNLGNRHTQEDRYNKEVDTIDTVPGLKETLQAWMESLTSKFEGSPSIEQFEYKSRDGFAAHGHNRGGLDYFEAESVMHILAGGKHFDTSIEGWVSDQYNEAVKTVKAEHPELADDSEAFYDLVDESLDSESDCVAFRVRAMYEGNGMICIHIGYDRDAPYFRWKEPALLTKEIRFRTLSGLKKQLKAIEAEISKL